MNRALIFAGGKGVRMKMNGDTPKQFLKIQGKSIIIHTLEKFEKCEDVDDIVVICIGPWIDELDRQCQEFNITKVSKILEGGATGFDSRMIGLTYLMETLETDDDIVLIHDGVRPFITPELISKNIEVAKEFGNAITVAQATETTIYKRTNEKDIMLTRDNCLLARAPQTFKVKEIYGDYLKAERDGNTSIVDSASIADFYGEKLYYVVGPQENIKVTTPIDFYTATGLITSSGEEMDIYR